MEGNNRCEGKIKGPLSCSPQILSPRESEKHPAGEKRTGLVAMASLLHLLLATLLVGVVAGNNWFTKFVGYHITK